MVVDKKSWLSKLLHKSITPAPGLLLLLIAVVFLLSVYYVLSKNAHDNLQVIASQQMNQLQNSLESMLGKHVYLPALLSVMPTVREFATNPPDNPVAEELFNRQLAHYGEIANTLNIYLMDPDGKTIASSNWNKENSFIGKNFSFRPYFQQAVNGQTGRYYALGTASGERGYYFAHPVTDSDKNTVGVIAVKVDIRAIETEWNTPDIGFMITDQNGVVFMSSRSDWQIKSLSPLSTVVLEEIYQSRRYADSSIEALDKFSTVIVNENISQTTFADKTYLHLQKEILADGWKLHILADRSEAQKKLLLTFILVMIVALLAWSLLYLIIRYQKQRRMYELQIRRELKKKIEKRTMELKLVQEDLVQAAKMAALGQLSAGINHELNNPLAAIRAYASNAVQFLEKGEYDTVKSNLEEIDVLTDKMAIIARQLKSFSRKSHGDIEAVELQHALEAALLMVQPKLTRENVQLIKDIDPVISHVQADLLWLEQIIVNLLDNAIEAVMNQDDKKIWLRITKQGNNVAIEVSDNGSGIVETDIEQIFEAFFTTKDPGKGLGLGLSISYRLAKDMQGNLTVQNASAGGAQFILTLPIAHIVKSKKYE